MSCSAASSTVRYGTATVDARASRFGRDGSARKPVVRHSRRFSRDMPMRRASSASLTPCASLYVSMSATSRGVVMCLVSCHTRVMSSNAAHYRQVVLDIITIIGTRFRSPADLNKVRWGHANHIGH